MGRSGTRLWRTALAALLLALPARALPGDKTDVVMLVNGDRISGDVRELSRGKLRFKTDTADTIYIDWTDVVSLVSKYDFQVEVSDGTRYFGELVAPPSPGILRVAGVTVVWDLDLQDVVAITEIKRTFLERLDGSVGVGFSYTKGSDVLQFSFNTDVEYRTREYRVDFDLASIVTRQQVANTTSRENASLGYTRFLPDRWLWRANTSAEHNDELGIQLRGSAGASVGRSLVQTSQNYLYALAGANVTREIPVGGAPQESNLEGLLAAEYSLFRYEESRTDLRTTLAVHPGITDWGRVRTNLDATLRRKFVGDLYWDLTFYFSYDNRPPSTAAAKSDYGIITSLSYSF